MIYLIIERTYCITIIIIGQNILILLSLRCLLLDKNKVSDLKLYYDIAFAIMICLYICYFKKNCSDKPTIIATILQPIIS